MWCARMQSVFFLNENKISMQCTSVSDCFRSEGNRHQTMLVEEDVCFRIVTTCALKIVLME